MTRLIDPRMGIFLGLLFLVTVLVPAGNLLAEPGIGLHVPSHIVALLGKYLCYALLAVSLDLVLGLRRHPVARPRRVLRARRLRDRHAHDARDRRARRLRQPDLPDFMVFLGYTEAAVVLARLRHVLVRLPDGAAGAGPARLRLRLLRLPQPRHRRLPLDHHPGADLRADARVLPQRDGLRRQQRPDRLPRRPRLLAVGRHHARRAVRPDRRWRSRAGCCSAGRSPSRSSARCWSACATPRAGRGSSATGSSTTSSSSSPSRR